MMSSATPRVSVIMSVRNGAATVAAAVRSLQLQTLSDWELIVIDDGSTDQTSSIVSGLGDPRIRLYREAASAGLAARLNQAVALSRAEFIARMDADDICFPERLVLQVERLEADKHVDVIGCGAVVFTDGGDLVGELNVGLTHEQIAATPLGGFPFPHPTWCGRAGWFRSNPYDSALMAAEDQDLLLRTFRNSEFGSLDRVMFGYRQNHLTLKKLLTGRRTFVRSLSRYARRSSGREKVYGAIATQMLKGAIDIATVGLGLNHFAQMQRLKPVDPVTRSRWQDLRERLAPVKLVA